MGVGSLGAIFHAPVGATWGIVTLGEIERIGAPYLTLNSSSRLLLALASTAIIAVVVLYLTMGRRRRALVAKSQREARARTS